MAGSNQTIVSIRNLKDGYKELETGYFKMMGPDDFKKAYIADYGHEVWDKRGKLLVDEIVSREQFFEKTRADLSSK